MNHHCHPDDLRQLLNVPQDSHAFAPESQTTLDHLDNCEQCQHKLELLAAGDWWWNEGRDFVAAASSDEMRVTGETSGIRAVGELDSASPMHWPTDFLAPPTQPDLLGRLGKYQIESVVGHGGMGMVFRGFDTELHRTIAIKVLAPHLACNPNARKRFAREAKAAAAVVHDHVVSIYGIETEEDLPYIVMPFVSGQSLQKYVEQHGPLDTKTIIRIGMQVAAGLAAAHEQGLVHRDIKPANILMEHEGKVLITDFGLARAADDASITRSGLVAGTPHYMSPEQANGDSIDARSDLFSLGSVLFFMATGRAPFRGESAMSVLHAICHKDPEPLRSVDPEIPRAVECLVGRLLEKSPQDRCGSAAKLREVLADYLAHLQNPLHTRMPAEVAGRPPMHGLLTIAGVLAICLLAVFLWTSTHTAASHEPTSPPTHTTSSPLADYANPERARGGDTFVSVDGFQAAQSALAAEFEEVENQWQPPAAPIVIEDGWEAERKALEQAIGETEQAWLQ